MADGGRRQVWPWYWGAPAGGGIRARHPELSWEWVERRLATDPVYWLVTASPREPPSPRPVWGVWLDERLMFGSGSPRHRRDLAVSANATAHLASGAEVVIVEGAVEVVRDVDLRVRYVEAYNIKYDWNLIADDVGVSFTLEGQAPVHGEVKMLVPRTVFAWTDDGGAIPGSGAPHSIGKWVYSSQD